MAVAAADALEPMKIAMAIDVAMRMALRWENEQALSAAGRVGINGGPVGGAVLE